MLPIYLVSKTGLYNINIDGATIKTRVADQPAAVDIGIDELKAEIKNMEHPPLVGLDHKSVNSNACLLILKTGSRCLIIQLSRMSCDIKSLLDFLNDQTICFLGFSIAQKIRNIACNDFVECKTGIEVGDLAARIVKNPKLAKSSLPDLAREIGILNEVRRAVLAPVRHARKIIGTPSSGSGLSSSSSGSGSGCSSVLWTPDWTAKFFSSEEVMHAILEANLAYIVGKKLLSMI